MTVIDKNYLVEMDGIALYRSMASAEKDEKRAAIFEKLAENEERHAQRWARLIQSAGGMVPHYRPSLRVSVRWDGSRAQLRNATGDSDHQQPRSA